MTDKKPKPVLNSAPGLVVDTNAYAISNNGYAFIAACHNGNDLILKTMKYVWQDKVEYLLRVKHSPSPMALLSSVLALTALASGSRLQFLPSRLLLLSAFLL
jgi:hypothetical protein